MGSLKSTPSGSSRPAAAVFSGAEARRIALAAQGFANASRSRLRRPFDDALNRMHIVQIDSVNVFSRSHYMPMLSRHGSYDREAFDRHLWRSGEFTEYWAHEAAFLPVTDRPLFGWRMADYRARHVKSGRAEALAAVMTRVRDRLASDGPQLVRELDDAPRNGRGPWWDWSDTKHAVEMLFAEGEVVSVGREAFQRRYALAEQALPAEVQGEVARADAQRSLIARASCALGIATLSDLADYHRQKPAEVRTAVRDLEDEGVLVPARVAPWVTSTGSPEPAWLHRDARVPSRLAPSALLTPFDPLVWFRPRAERVFGFRYRLEIYTTKEKRQYGYYCLPLLVSGRMAGRLDLKAERPKRAGDPGALLVQAAWQEPGAPAHTAETAVRLLAEAASWQGLAEVRVMGAGNLPLPTQFEAAQAPS